MKVSVVPAQVTTIEDRIAGNLGLSQLLLLTLPIFGGSILYLLLPPFGRAATYKLVAIVLLSVIAASLAIRIRGKLLLSWLSVISRYNLRPRHYVYNKQTLAGRPLTPAAYVKEESEVVATPSRQRQLLNLTTAEIAKVQHFMENPAAKMSFKTSKKGGLRVLITEVKEQS